MTEVLSMVFIAMFIAVIGFVMLYIGYKRKGVLWCGIATVLFSINLLYSGSIPFQVDAAGAVIANSANMVLFSLNLLFCMVALIATFFYSFWVFKQKQSYH